MGTLLVTVAHGARRRDLAVRSDVPIADLLGPLAEVLVTDRARHGGAPGVGLGLAPLCGPPLPVERSLAACGLGHGAVLVLFDETPRPAPRPPATGTPGPRDPARTPGHRSRATRPRAPGVPGSGSRRADARGGSAALLG